MQDKKILSAKSKNLLGEYSTVIVHAIDEILKEANQPLSGQTVDEIALEYKRREGIKYGAQQILSKINNYANEE